MWKWKRGRVLISLLFFQPMFSIGKFLKCASCLIDLHPFMPSSALNYNMIDYWSFFDQEFLMPDYNLWLLTEININCSTSCLVSVATRPKWAKKRNSIIHPLLRFSTLSFFCSMLYIATRYNFHSILSF